VSRIVWLSSYPKSGNTWLRAFITNLQLQGGSPGDINGLKGTDAAGRLLFDDILGLESSDMTEDEIERCRPCVYRKMALQALGSLFLKVHDAYTYIDGGEPLIPAEATHCAIYLVRNPLDVAISFAHHSALTLDESIDRMANETFAFSSTPELLHRHLKQRLLSWSNHVLSWLDQQAISVYVLRYEDMHDSPLTAFTGALRFLGMNIEPHRIQQALEFSSFSFLQEQERKFGFRETPSGANCFFRSGRVGEWREVLSPDQAARIVRDHGAVMRRLGYITDREVLQ
jgi:Sulfotransferase domain